MIYTVTLNPAVDRELTVPALEWDTVLRASKQRADVGGKGLNVSRMVQQLGGESIALGFVGGLAGRLLADSLQECGVATDFVWIAEETRTNVSIVTTEGGHSLKVNEIGPTITAAEQGALVRKVLDSVNAGDWCVLSGSLPPNVSSGLYAELTTELQKQGAQVILDASGEALRLGCAARPFLVTPNTSEATELTQQTTPIDAAQQLRRMGPDHVIVTLGCEGAMLVDDDGIFHIATPEIVERNAIGAGDALVGGLVHALAEESPLNESLHWGVASGTIAASLAGTAFGDRTEIESMLGQLRQRCDYEKPTSS